ncbi:PaaI family thioesterase [Niveispirillum fermenti]|uniref:PaaI family thioesterase n=1 Tax=Niveispirillum fermenti TaxID=1233113 RepID=UPI003A88849B
MLKIILPLLFKVRPKMVHDMIRQQMAGSLPFVRHCGIDLVSLGDGTAEARVTDRAEVKNHLGTPHAGVIFTLAETASGGAMAGAMAPVLMNIRPVAAQATIQYLTLARGDLRAVARTGRAGADLRAELAAEGKVRFPVEVEITDAAGQPVSKMVVEWYVSPKRP